MDKEGNMKGTWFELRSTHMKKKPPQWARRFFVEDSGEAWYPAAVFANETSVYFCLAYDGVPSFTEDGHLYVPEAWARKEYAQVFKDHPGLTERIKEAKVKEGIAC